MRYLVLSFSEEIEDQWKSQSDLNWAWEKLETIVKKKFPKTTLRLLKIRSTEVFSYLLVEMEIKEANYVNEVSKDITLMAVTQGYLATE